MKKKYFFTIIFSIILLFIILPNVYGGYQCYNRNTTIQNNYGNTWISGIRNMEKAGQGMGLYETIDYDTLRSTSGSNNMDIHMMKNTEYGAMILLGASDFGKQGDLSTNTYYSKDMYIGQSDYNCTTTGNWTGVYEMDKTDFWVAAGGSTKMGFENIAPKYYDLYTTEKKEQHIGDAMIGTETWQHASTNSSYKSNWLTSDSYNIHRNFINGNTVFSYRGEATYSNNKKARPVIVCGEGF